MDGREQQHRKINHRLNVLPLVKELTGNVAQTCRYFGTSRPTFYKCATGTSATDLMGCATGRAPHHMAHAPRDDVVGKITRSLYHFGPQKSSMYLPRHHPVKISPSGSTGTSTGSG